MKHLLSIFCIVAVIHTSLAQKPDPIAFGQVSMDELTMKAYAQDSTAEAVVLADYGQIHYEFDDRIRLFYERIVRIKILKKTGYHWASGAIYINQLNDTFEFVEKLEGATYNLENGSQKIYPMSKDAIFDEKQDNGWHKIKFTLPQIREGSVIEYHYILSSNRWYHINNWNFQVSIPTQWSEFRAVIPGYFDFKITLQSYQQLSVNESENGKRGFLRSAVQDPYISYRFAMKDIPALPEGEPFITTLEDYRYKINFELARTFFPERGEKNYSVSYADMTKTLLEDENFGLPLKRFRKIAEKWLEGFVRSDTLTDIETATRLVKQKMRWNGYAQVMTEENTLTKVLEKGVGNATEMNLMLVAVLRAMGYEANPVILSTRSHGRVSPEFALVNSFNYTIAQTTVAGKDILLDSTEPFVALGMLPKRCLNKEGWLLHPTKPRWVPLTPRNKYGKYVVVDLKIGDTQQLNGMIDIAYIGYAAADFREEVATVGKNKFLENYQKKFITWQAPTIELVDIDSLGKPAKIVAKTTINEAYTIAGNRIYLQPLLGMGLNENPFKVQSRTYPIDFAYPSDEIYTFIYTLPDGYEVEELPANLSTWLGENSNRFLYEIKQNENQLIIKHVLSLRKTIFDPENYEALRKFYDKIVSKHAEQIILKKK